MKVIKRMIGLAAIILLSGTVMVTGAVLGGCNDLRGQDGVDGVSGQDGATGSAGPAGASGVIDCVGCVTDIQLGDSAVGTINLKDNSVTTEKIMDGQVFSSDIANGTIAGLDLGPNAVYASSVIASGAVTSDDIQNGTISSVDLGPNVINASSLIGPGAVRSSDIAAGQVMNIHFGESITTAQILNGTLLPGDMSANVINGSTLIATGAVTTDDIRNGTIQTVDIGQNQITGGLTGKIALSTITKDNMSLNSVGNAQLEGDAVTSDKIKNGEVSGGDLAPDAVSDTTKIASGAVSMDDIADSLSGTTLGARNTLTQFWTKVGNNDDVTNGATVSVLDDMTINQTVRGGIYLVLFDACFRIQNRPNTLYVELMSGTTVIDYQGLAAGDTAGVERRCVSMHWAGFMPQSNASFRVQWYCGQAGKNAYHDWAVDKRTLTLLELTR